MKNQKTVIITVAVLAVLVGVVLLVTNGKDNDNDKDNSPAASSSTPATTETTTPAANNNAVAATAVSISSFDYTPGTITVKVGATVTWTNNDDVNHTVTANTASANAPDSKTFGKGETYSFTFDKAGTYAYHCQLHSSMQGTVVVTE